MRTRVFAAVLATVMLSFGMPAQADDTVQSLYEAAKAEGKVVYWSGNDVKTNRGIADKFAERYPGIAVELFKIEPGPALERIATEATAGRHTVDVFDATISYMPQMLDRGLVEPYPWDKIFGLPAESLLFGGRALRFFELDTPIAYNSTMASAGDLKSWDSLLDEKWRGKLLLEVRGLPFPILAQIWGEDRTFTFLKRLLALDPVIIRGATPTMEALAGGQGAIAIGSYTGRVLEYKKAGAPVEWARVSPIPAMLYVASALKDAPHPAGARLFTAFLTTAEAQQALYANQYFGRLTGEHLSPLGEEMTKAGLEVVVESTDAALMRQRLARAGEIIGQPK